MRDRKKRIEDREEYYEPVFHHVLRLQVNDVIHKKKLSLDYKEPKSFLGPHLYLTTAQKFGVDQDEYEHPVVVVSPWSDLSLHKTLNRKLTGRTWLRDIRSLTLLRQALSCIEWLDHPL